jgi:predicted DNA-binding transcriptional regulator YafY
MTDKNAACVATLLAALEHVPDPGLRAAAREALTELLRQLPSATREHFYRWVLPTL